MSGYIAAYMENKVNKWFHTAPLFDYTPEQFVTSVATDFLEVIQTMKMHICCSDEEFVRAMCNAICTFYVAEKRGEDMSLPHRIWPRPVGWSADCEVQWMQTLQYCYLDSLFWESFWKRYPDMHDFYEKFSGYLTSILPYYVARNIDILYKHKVVVMDRHGDNVLWENCDDGEDEEDV